MLSGKTIKELRRKKNLTQNDFADALGVNRSMVAKYEAGTAGMTLNTLDRLCTILEASPNEILGVKNQAKATTNNLDRELLAILAEQIKQKDIMIKELERKIEELKKKR